MSKLSEYLNRHISGNVFDRASLRRLYSRDNSIIEITPQLVALPDNPNDVRHLLRFVYQLAARDLQIPITPRGTGLDKTGAAIGSGLILSTERLNRLEELDVCGRLVRVQPGLTLGELNNLLRFHNLWLPIGANPKSTIGGLISTNPIDDYFSRYGGIMHAVKRVELVLPNGELIQLAPYSNRQIDAKIASKTTEGALYHKLCAAFDENADAILDRAMQPHDAMGYSNVIHVREGRLTSLLPLIFGAQGTLGVITDIILRAEPLPRCRRRLLVSFHDLKAAERFLNLARDLDPYELQLYDLDILEAAADTGKRSNLFTRKVGKGVLVLVGFDSSSLKTAARIRSCTNALPDGTLRVEENTNNTDDFQALVNLLSAYLNPDSRGELAPVLDDVYIPAASFNDFWEGVRKLEDTLGLSLPIFGSFLNSNYNVRPNLNLATLEQRKKLLEFIKMYSELVGQCGGSITGNNPEGRVKMLAPNKQLGVGERQVYAEIKEAFDPLGIMNPGVKLSARPRDTLSHLRETGLDTIIS